MCRTPPGVRGLKREGLERKAAGRGRTPPGVRGLKRNRFRNCQRVFQSHPTRGAWIETRFDFRICKCHKCRTPPGVRGLKHCNLSFRA